MLATVTPTAIRVNETEAGNDENASRMARTMMDPSSTPTVPPNPASVTASSRNCVRILDWRAPMALRTPISRVRSVTLTSMMFITPMPPTSSATEPTASITMKIPLEI